MYAALYQRLHQFSYERILMKLSFSSSQASAVKSDAVVLFVLEDKEQFTGRTSSITEEFAAAAPVVAAGDFKGKKDSIAVVYTEAKSARLMLVGLGESDKLTPERLRRAAAAAAKRAVSLKLSHIAFELPQLDMAPSELARAITEGALLSVYKFDKYISDDNSKTSGQLTALTFFSDDKNRLNEAKAGATLAQTIVRGVNLTRDLANAPNNEIYPESLAERAVQAGKEAGFKVTVLNKKKIESLNMNGLLGVNRGSARPPVFIIMEYMKGPRNEQPVVLVGKGVTFDSGGISIKPSAGMGDMRMDRHGAATVIGAMYAIAKAGLKKNVVALVPATDNMPDGSAIVPGDVITYSNGLTVEVDNTDAEGRLILADALIYAKKYKPAAVIDLATLTGACVVALGHTTSGLMGTDADLKNRIKQSAGRTNEYVCELPLYEEYEELIKSDYADIKNSGGRAAGSITAGLFLKRFTDYPWAHLDIAGTGIAPKETAYMPKGGTGVGVRLLCDVLMNWDNA